MKFRPCIDIHNGKVKQIVGSSLRDEGDRAVENYVSKRGAAWYADLFRRDALVGGHVILLNHKGSPYYEATKSEAEAALSKWPGGLQAGGGITDKNAAEFLEAGASHVIVTSFVFSEGKIRYENLDKLVSAVGKERVVLDLSCRRRPKEEVRQKDAGMEDPLTDMAGKDGGRGDSSDGQPYFIMTDRWQKYTDTVLDAALMEKLSAFCSEFLVHAVASEGLGGGIDADLAEILADSPIPVTYAGGIRSLDDIEELRRRGKGRVDYTVGSALDLYGGSLPYEALVSGSRDQARYAFPGTAGPDLISHPSRRD